MAEVEEPKFNSLAERIAALNRQKNFQAPSGVANKRPPPPPPVRSATTQIEVVNRASKDDSSDQTAGGGPPMPPPRPVRAATERAPPLPRRQTDQQPLETPSPASTRSLPPPLPSRSSQQQLSPALPARRPSGQPPSGRRNSNSSDISHLSAISSLSTNTTISAGADSQNSQATRRLPPSLDQAKLPPLPPTRRELEAKAKEAAQQEAAAASRTPVLAPKSTPSSVPPVPGRPSLPPRLPSRPVKPASTTHATEESSPALPPRRLPPPPSTYRTKSALESGFGGSGSRSSDPAPPPIPLSTRPDFAQIDAVRAAAPASGPAAATGPSCLVCRDYSGPDNAAAQHPVHTLPRHDPVGYLAHVLCDPFPSPTDKARAIFTWCHHNIAYDVHGFFNNCIPRGQTPAESIFSGKAVCEGYARIYEAIALRAGLGCIVITGHGKGYGFTPLKSGQPPPPRDATGHAWNAVQIDNGYWKVIDACWGAGHLSGGLYKKEFSPDMFTLSNELIGLKHFPENSGHFFRDDGRIPTWEEYVMGLVPGQEPAQWYGHATQEGLNEFNFQPMSKHISVYQGEEVVRFRFAKICPHWTSERNGKGGQALFALSIKGLDGRKGEILLLETDGVWYWIDVRRRDLGCPGQQIQLVAIADMDGQVARGMTRPKYLAMKNKGGYKFTYLISWELVQ